MDPANLPVSADGVGKLFWPLPPDHHFAMRDQVLNALCSFIHGLRRAREFEAACLSVLAHHIILDAAEIYEASKVVSTFRSRGMEIVPPACARGYIALCQDAVPQAPAIVRWLMAGRRQPSVLRFPLRFARDLIVQKHIRRRPMRRVDLYSDIVAVSNSPIMEIHAREATSHVVFVRPERWLANCDQSKAGNIDTGRLSKNVVDILDASFTGTGVVFGDLLRDYFSGWITESLDIVSSYLAHLQRQQTTLPKRLWTATGGDIWSRLLRHVVYANGGYVAGHDHGSGTGQCKEIINRHKGVNEFEAVNEYFVYTPEHAEDLRASVSEVQTTRLALPKIASVSAETGTKVYAKEFFDLGSRLNGARGKGSDRPRKIMILSSFYFGGKLNLQSSLPDIVNYDMESRLVAGLVRSGFEVIYKPHPPIATRPPPDFAEVLGAVELNRPSEEVVRLADVVLCTDTMSTAFVTTMALGLPIVALDFGLYPFHDHANRMLADRVAVVTCGRDENGRVELDIEAIRGAIHRAPSLNSGSFQERYFGAQD